MRKTALSVAAVLAAAALLAAGVAVAALAGTSSGSATLAETSETNETNESTTETEQTTTYAAALNAKAEVPKPKGVPTGAKGTFAVTLTQKGSTYTVSWKLTYAKLSGKATAAHVHKAKPGKAGPVVLALCGPCTSGKTGKARVSKAVVDAMKAGTAYINVHTARNPKGEIRGQVKVKKA
jgi:hypothetical protein